MKIIKIIFLLILRVAITFIVLGLFVFLLWGALYLMFLK